MCVLHVITVGDKTSGERLGIHLRRVGRHVVVESIDDACALRSDIDTGDVLVRVNGKDVGSNASKASRAIVAASHVSLVVSRTHDEASGGNESPTSPLLATPHM